jgi:hypothetical protein
MRRARFAFDVADGGTERRLTGRRSLWHYSGCAEASLGQVARV